MAAFIAEVQNFKAVKTAAWMAGQQLTFGILTGVRPGEMFKMRWAEINWQERIWDCPGDRTKGKRAKKPDHQVPLSEPALALLKNLLDLQKQARLEPEFVFVRALPRPAHQIYYDKQRLQRQRELANVPLPKSAAVLLLQRTLGRKDITVHGSATNSFRSWAKEVWTPNKVWSRNDAEEALSHKVEGKTESIYTRDAKRL